MSSGRPRRKAKKRSVRLVFAATAAALLLVIVGGVWVLKDRLSGSAEPTQVASTETVEPERELKANEVFEKRSPGVPMVEAVDSGHGSGFLVDHQGKLFVITNRHVIEDANKGMAVHFIRKNSAGAEEKQTVPATDTQVIAVHKEADLAIIDVNKATTKIRNEWKIKPVPLAPKANVVKVGERVYAIGHPSDGNGGVLSLTQTEGTVSQSGRKMDSASFLQVTAAINPGNSGGPLFDSFGRVIGVNTFIIRGGRNGVALEGLDFALESSFIHELLANRSKSYGEQEIAALMGTGTAAEQESLTKQAQKMQAMWKGKGFTLSSQRTVKLPPHQVRIIPLPFLKTKRYAAQVVSEGGDELGVLILTNEARPRRVAQDGLNKQPSVEFSPPSNGRYVVVIVNESEEEATVNLSIFEK